MAPQGNSSSANWKRIEMVLIVALIICEMSAIEFRVSLLIGAPFCSNGATIIILREDIDEVA
ncbi:hypothetical protein DDR33_15360 [Pararcticibacter amylolyticus]|uniref:Uncharacterized protein n=1 Tax=Pararcticibacter amylolyticus TaxID=2173175 RepID=A0A2U2PEG0_9SPHI|nr:hypothetical protein DDR33_15360 [Pararcticibacter amylolyticus]